MLYSLVHINETSPYEVFAYKEDTVYFITDDGSEYLVGFIEETAYVFTTDYYSIFYR